MRVKVLGLTAWASLPLAVALMAGALLAACSGPGSWRLVQAAPTVPTGGLPPMATPRRALGAAVYEGLLYAAGGWNGESTQLSAVEIYDPAGKQWTSGPPLVHARSQHSLVSTGAGLWAVGGWSADEGLVSAVEMLDAASGAWQTVTHLPTPRREPGVAWFGGEIVVAGGFDGWNDAEQDGYSVRVEAYDPELGRWRRLPALGQPRRGLSLVAAGGSLYAVGGYGPDGKGFLNTVERYMPGDANTAAHWEQLDWPITPRTWVAAAVVPSAAGQAILLIGGFNQQGFLDLVERVDPISGEVCRPPPLAGGRSWSAAAVLGDRVLLLGGETPEGFTAALTEAAAECPP